MEQSSRRSRRVFLGGATLAGLAVATARPKTAIATESVKPRQLKLGLASYSTRAFSLDETIAMTQALGLKYLNLKSYHLPLDSSHQECRAAAKKVKEAGLTLMGGGVIRLPNNKDVVRSAFDYAKAAGMPTIVGTPDPSILPFINELVQEYNIALAIHNHGPMDPHFPSPLDAHRHVENFDRRIGICMDIGHTVRNGEDEIAAIHAVKDRLLDFHIKDVSSRERKGGTVEMGRGVVRLPEAIKTLADIGFTGHVAIEYEKDKDAPLPGLSECVGFFRGVATSLELA